MLKNANSSTARAAFNNTNGYNMLIILVLSLKCRRHKLFTDRNSRLLSRSKIMGLTNQLREPIIVIQILANVNLVNEDASADILRGLMV